ncbi:MAG: hypothetical protein WC729_05635 [Sphingomonas sp.]|jgi:hypothetical protein|uniref:terminase small subunit-like protein n=1 Tax=Sphingomonas sp. TaxID=28214 RepID=UPI00356A8438
MNKRRTALIEEILLAGIADGRTLAEMCREIGVNRNTVLNWTKDEDFAARMARARALGFDAIADQMLEIADDSRNDWVARADAAAGDAPVRNPDNIARAKLRIDTRLRLLMSWNPKRYGAAQPSFAGMAGMAGMIGVVAGAADARAPAEPVAIAARLAALLATIGTRAPEDGTLIEHDPTDHGGDTEHDDDPD